MRATARGGEIEYVDVLMDILNHMVINHCYTLKEVYGKIKYIYKKEYIDSKKNTTSPITPTSVVNIVQKNSL